MVLASGLPEIEGFEPQSDQAIATPLADLLRDPEFLSRGRSGIVELPGNILVVYSLMMGEASQVEGSRVGYAIVRQAPAMLSSTEFMSNASMEDWRELWQSPSGVSLIVGTVLMLVLGFLGFHFENGRPIRVLRREVGKLATREVDRLNIYALSRRYRKIAEAINKTLDKVVADVAEKLQNQPADVDQILGPSSSNERVSSAFFTFPDMASEDVPPPPPRAPAGASPAPGAVPPPPASASARPPGPAASPAVSPPPPPGLDGPRSGRMPPAPPTSSAKPQPPVPAPPSSASAQPVPSKSNGTDPANVTSEEIDPGQDVGATSLAGEAIPSPVGRRHRRGR